MKLGIAMNVYNKVDDVARNVYLWKKRFTNTESVISVFSNGVNFNPPGNSGLSFYGHRLQAPGAKRLETPLTIMDAARPLLNMNDLDFILWMHSDYFYLDEKTLMDKLQEIKDKGLVGGAHLDCPCCKDSSEFYGIKKTMGDVRAISAYCVILTPEFMREYDFIYMRPFKASVPDTQNGGTADTWTAHFYEVLGDSWQDMIMDFSKHGPDELVNENSWFPDVHMVHTHAEDRDKYIKFGSTEWR